ncbi:MAG: type II toxin-antitoxin system HicA family toxin [Dehalococcoidia bacterium]|nr:type II toxin-antitoxin system HicA family toxin [Dehalococcoidia bacterium]
MTRLPRLDGQAVLEVLQRGGYLLSHVRGSHHYLRKPNAPNLVVVPVHGSHIIPIGTMRSILRQAKLTPEEFETLYRQ